MITLFVTFNVDPEPQSRPPEYVPTSIASLFQKKAPPGFQVRMQVQMLSSKLGGESAELRELLKRIGGLPIGEQLAQTTAALRRLQQQQQQ